MKRFLSLLFLYSLGASFSHAQSAEVKMLRTIYEQDGKFFTKTMQTADKLSYPLYVAIPASFWIAAIAEKGITKSEAMNMTAAFLGTVATTSVLKKMIRRDRPFVNESGIDCYRGRDNCSVHANASMPSGHTSMAFSLATSASLLRPKWYVIAPSYLLATTISTSRMWNGVHYPSDVLAGAFLGTGSAIIVHQFVKGYESGRKAVFLPLNISPTQISFQISF